MYEWTSLSYFLLRIKMTETKHHFTQQFLKKHRALFYYMRFLYFPVYYLLVSSVMLAYVTIVGYFISIYITFYTFRITD